MRNNIIIAVIIAVSFYAIGRYTTPDHVVVKEVEKKVIVEVEKKHENKITVITKKPDGSVVTVIHDKTDTDKNTDITDEKSKLTETSKNAPLNLALLMCTGDFRTTTYGASLTKQVLGPLTLGVFGFTDKRVGLSIGVNL